MLERIGKRERYDLLIAWLAISVAFTLIFVRNRVDPLMFLLFFIISAGTVGIGFVVHEMAHKFSALRFGYWAEFRKDNVMLLVAVLLAALVGVVFAAPGATIVYGGGGVTRSENGKISAAGPLSNLLLCIPFALILFAGKAIGSGIVGLVGMVGLQVNTMLAAFNMIPVSVLDGRKVLAWNPGVFAVIAVAAFGLVFLVLSGAFGSAF